MGQQTLGGYRVGGLVRQTGLGPVHEGACPRGEPVHLLLIPRPEQVSEEAWRQTMATFDADLQAAASLKHPNIVRLLGVGEESGVHYVVMEAVRGETLAVKIASEGTPILARTAPRFAQICGAVAHAHENGVIHGDLSPDDIVVTADGNALLSNFGMAHMRRQAVNRYMAPEVIRGELPDAQADLFSLGAIFYEMVAARPAFPGVTTQQIRDAITGTRPPEPLAEQPAYVQAIALKALARKREARYQSAADLLADLRAKRQPAGFDKVVVNALGEEDAHVVQWQPAPDETDRHAQELENAISAAEHIQGAVQVPRTHAPRRWLGRAVLAAAAVGIVVIGSHARSLARRGNVLEVVHSRGSASSFRLVTEVPKSLVPGSRVRVGDTIRTGPDSSILLKATDGTALRVGSETRVMVTSLAFDPRSRARNRTLYMEKGRVVVRASKQRKGSVLAITTPRARVAVVGTLFSVDTPNGLATTVDVLEGTTQVMGAGGQESVGAGKGVAVTAAGTIREPKGLTEEKKKRFQEALAELEKLEGRFAELQQALLDLEEGALVATGSTLLEALRFAKAAGPGSDDGGEDAGSLAKATASMIAICSALEVCAVEEDYPEKLDLATLEELQLGKENAKVMLSSFQGEKLESYRRTGGSYEFTARANDKAGTLLKATQGRVTQVAGSGGGNEANE